MGARDYLEMRRGAGLAYLGVFLVTVIVAGVMGGDWLDRRFHTAPWFAMIGLFVGLVAGFREMTRAITTARNIPAFRATASPPRKLEKWTPPSLEEESSVKAFKGASPFGTERWAESSKEDDGETKSARN